MAEENSEVVKIVEERIRESIEAEKKDIKEESARLTDRAVERINGVYASILATLRQLDIKDASLLEFYTKAGGRVRSVEGIIEKFEQKLYINMGGRDLTHQDPIILKPGKKYKVILMAIEEGDVKVE